MLIHTSMFMLMLETNADITPVFDSRTRIKPKLKLIQTLMLIVRIMVILMLAQTIYQL